MDDETIRDASGRPLGKRGGWLEQMANAMPDRQGTPPPPPKSQADLDLDAAYAKGAAEMKAERERTTRSDGFAARMDAQYQAQLGGGGQATAAPTQQAEVRQVINRGRELGWSPAKIAQALNKAGAPGGPYDPDRVADLGM